jgi:hypothetical protein
MNSDTAANQQILDHIAIQDLLSTYHHAVTLHHDADAFAQLFTPNATWDCVGPPNFSFKGAEVGPGLKHVIEFAPNLVHTHMPAIIVINGDSATARSIMHEFGDLADGSGHVSCSGVYEDKLVKIQGKWKFQSRYFTIKQLWKVP